jgi:hypothetical protein
MKLEHERFHTPVSPYVAGVYNSLCTVVQAAPLGGLFWIIWHKPLESLPCALDTPRKPDCYFFHPSFFDQASDAIRADWQRVELGSGFGFSLTFRPELLLVYLKIILVLTTVSVIWHRYVVDDQFVAWRLSFPDTFFLFLLGIFETLLGLSILYPNILFVIWVVALIFVAICTYSYIIFKLSRPETDSRKQTPLKLYKEHFGDELGANFLAAVKNYFWENNIFLIISLLVMVILAFLTAYYDMSFLIVLFFTLIIEIILVWDRISYRLRDVASRNFSPSLFRLSVSGGKSG